MIHRGVPAQLHHAGKLGQLLPAPERCDHDRPAGLAEGAQHCDTLQNAKSPDEKTAALFRLKKP